ncbi:MAG: lysine--tRNA ligase [Armatimonadetes bacterium]|nr:lysine--tRNA ligase [Armatimonadota bacterium]
MWVDVIVEDVLKTRPQDRYVINDAKSPSGPIHVGSLRGVVLHDCILRGLAAADRPARFLFGFDDYDPMDSRPVAAPAEFDQYLGMPLSEVPSPAGGRGSFGRYYGLEFIEVWKHVGAHPEVYWTSEMYKSGKFNETIRTALDRAEDLIQIDREISGSQKADRHPVQPVCEHCGRVGTTVVVGWDGHQVEYECRPDKVTWAKGCGHRGKRSPFDGGSKLQYKAEWAAKWRILGVTIEGAGKDHMTKGGSHDVASAMVERIFNHPTPYPIPYEWFLVGGRKMSTSTGIGVPAAELVAILREELARFLMVRPHYRQQINFDPTGETIPNLYDEYDRAAAAFFGELEGKTPAETDLIRDHSRTFYYSRTNGEQPRCIRMRFAKVANLMQMPTVNLFDVAAKEKGAPLTAQDRSELQQRMEDARRWLGSYAPDHYRFQVQSSMPRVELSPMQREFLGQLAAVVAQQEWSGEELHNRIHDLKSQIGLKPKDAFSAIYLAFLGKDSGPQAGWLLASLDRAFVLARLRQASTAGVRGPFDSAQGRPGSEVR